MRSGTSNRARAVIDLEDAMKALDPSPGEDVDPSEGANLEVAQTHALLAIAGALIDIGESLGDIFYKLDEMKELMG